MGTDPLVHFYAQECTKGTCPTWCTFSVKKNRQNTIYIVY